MPTNSTDNHLLAMVTTAPGESPLPISNLEPDQDNETTLTETIHQLIIQKESLTEQLNYIRGMIERCEIAITQLHKDKSDPLLLTIESNSFSDVTEPARNLRNDSQSSIQPQPSPTHLRSRPQRSPISQPSTSVSITPTRIHQLRKTKSNQVIFASLEEIQNGSVFIANQPLITINFHKSELTPGCIEKLTSQHGLPVYSPSGQQYTLYRTKNTINKAMLTADQAQKSADESIEQHQQRIAVTIMNMIDNILLKHHKITINTQDPFLATIADLYLAELQQKTTKPIHHQLIGVNNANPNREVLVEQAKSLFEQLKPQLLPESHDDSNERPDQERKVSHQLREDMLKRILSSRTQRIRQLSFFKHKTNDPIELAPPPTPSPETSFSSLDLNDFTSGSDT